MELTNEQQEIIDKERRRKIIHLMKHAEPGNWAWKKIEELQGRDADYSPADIDGGDTDPRNST